MSRSDWASVGTSLIATAIVAFAGYWFTGLKGAVIIGLIGLGIVIVVQLVTKPKKLPEILPARTPLIDNSSKLTSTVNANPHFEPHFHFPSQQQAEAPRQTPPQPKAAKPLANIRFVHSRQVSLNTFQNGIWAESTNLRPFQGIIASFRNVPNSSGQHTPTARDVTATLLFKYPIEKDIPINHGVWLNVFEQSVTFEPGETHNLLVAAKLTPFVTFDNPNVFPFARTMKPVEPTKITIRDRGKIEITLIDAFGMTLFHDEFIYDFTRFPTMELFLHPGYIPNENDPS